MKYNEKSDKEAEEKVKEIIEAAPKICPITGLERCDSYIIDGQAVYVTNPAYDAYTLPEYDAEEEVFYRKKYDMDDDNREYFEFLCDLEDLVERPDYENIKRFYDIAS